MKIAIIGGAGFIGTHLTNAYLDAGHDVFVIDSLVGGSHTYINPRARFYHVDIRDEKLRTILQRERPTIVSHHASQPRHIAIGERTLADADVHVRGLINVLDGCVDASVQRVIFASGGNSLYKNVDVDKLPLNEDTPLCPRSSSDISKLAGEWYIRFYTQQYGLKHTILRYADVYGETEHTSLHHPLSYFINMLLNGQRPIIRGTGDDFRDHIFIEDVIEANLHILQKKAENQTFHISSAQGTSLNRLYRLLSIALDNKIEPLYLSNTGAETVNISLDNTHAQLLLGWAPRYTLTEGIQQAIIRFKHTEEQYAGPRETTTPSKMIIPAEPTLSRV